AGWGILACMTPIERVVAWLEDARRAEPDREPEAMALATVGADGAPSVRYVLCRGVDARGLRFFTNYESRKASELAANARAAAVFYWHPLGRQLRVEGTVERLPATESDAYFAGRPRGHQLSALASPQSRAIADLEELRGRASEADRQYADRDVPRPAYWGGYRLVPTTIELWQRGADRMHDRIRFDLRAGQWRETRLAP
ncbi:MAG TPA: pyridoxamine 5'-phosphate oxidase, partial [Polyangiaceae bacterium]